MKSMRSTSAVDITRISMRENSGNGNLKGHLPFLTLFRSCADKKDLSEGSRLHVDVIQMGLLEGNPYLSSSLINMYSKCGDLSKAQEVLEEVPVRDLVSWNALISGFSQHGKGQEALTCFERMQIEGHSPDVITFTCTIKACGIVGAIDKGKQIHAYILKKRLLEKDIVLGNALMDMYVKCDDLSKAVKVLEELPFQDVVSYSTLITRLSQQGKVHEAFCCFHQMQNQGIFPNMVTFICILKACGNIRSIEQGKQIHLQIISMGLLKKDAILGTALVDMYGKCNEHAKAKQVLKELPLSNAVSWSALIAGYARQDQSLEALYCFERMQNEGITPNVAIFICILKFCGSIGAVDKGKEIHNKIVSLGLLEKDVILGTALVDMYAKCGDLVKAQHVHGLLPVRDTISWNALIAGYTQHGKGDKALNSFEQMLSEGLSPDASTFVCILKACTGIGAVGKGKQVHDEIMAKGFLENDTILGNALLDMYGKCGMLAKAKEVLNELPVRNVVSWNALISGYVQQGQSQEALNCFEEMHRENLLSPDIITFICLLQACGRTGSIHKGKQIHEDIAHKGLLEKDVVLGNALVDMYAKCGVLSKAQEAFERLPIRNIVSWNVLIAGYAEHGWGNEAVNCFEQMQSEGLTADVVTFVSILKACGSAKALETGKQCHEIILTSNLPGKDIILDNALVDMYVKCGMLVKAQEIFQKIPNKNIVSWSALIGGYVQQGKCHKALKYFEHMQTEGLFPDTILYIFVLKASGNLGAIEKGKQIHASILGGGLSNKDISLATALVDMYSKCGVLSKAQGVLEEHPIRNNIIWSALMSGYAQQGQAHEAFNCFERMQSEGLSPDAIAFTCALQACGSLGSISKGQNLHDKITAKGLLQRDIVLGNALVDMYAKCGVLARAQEVLKEISIRDIIPWNVIIAGYAEQGKAHEALNCFYVMQREGINPDEVTFVSVLNACGHTGLLLEAENVFADMTSKYGIIPTLEHYTSIVVAFGCSGHFDKAIAIIKAMSLPHHSEVWLALLGTCRKWGNLRLARLIFDQILQANNTCAAAYVLMSTILAAAGMQDDAKIVEMMRLKYGA